MPIRSAIFEWGDPRAIAAEICHKLSAFLEFNGSDIYFTQNGPEKPELLEEEATLLLPLIRCNEITAVLRLDKVNLEKAQALLPWLNALLDLCLENASLHMYKELNPETGLYSEEALLGHLADRITAIRQLENPKDPCLGFVIISWPDTIKTNLNPESQAITKFRTHLEGAFRKLLPENAYGATLGFLEGKHELGAIFPTSGRGACQRLARKLLDALERSGFYNPLTQKSEPIHLCAGHALYPWDISGKEILSPSRKQALLLRDRARMAATMAWKSEQLQRPIMAYAWIPWIGGRIIERLPRRQTRINLGKAAGIKPGMRFHVVAKNQPWNIAASNAQIIIRQVANDSAIAEIIQFNRAGALLGQGDGLILMRDEDSTPMSGPLLSQTAFLRKFRQDRSSVFGLWISKFWLKDDASSEPLHIRINAIAQVVWQGSLDRGYIGQYGSNGIIGFLPDAKPEAIEDICAKFHKAAEDFGLEAATGIYHYPFLNFSREDSEACALKALRYAELLPAPHIGFLDALALAISADSRFSQGDELGALEEYRLALFLKPGDSVILNSLGVCLASLNRPEDARHRFQEALANCAGEDIRAKASYNLGTLYQKENALAEARHFYRQCIKAEPGHVYAWARLGQIHDMAGRAKSSRALYRHAARLAHDQPVALNMIQRQLARLLNERNEKEKAQEILHDSLLRDPADSASLLLLARTYLENDPQMAEILARKCLRFGGDAWGLLIESLNAQGREEEARLTAREREQHE